MALQQQLVVHLGVRFPLLKEKHSKKKKPLRTKELRFEQRYRVVGYTLEWSEQDAAHISSN